MTDNPLSKIEDEKAQTDMGIFGARIFRGAEAETESRIVAFLVTCAFFVGMFRANKSEDEPES